MELDVIEMKTAHLFVPDLRFRSVFHIFASVLAVAKKHIDYTLQVLLVLEWKDVHLVIVDLPCLENHLCVFLVLLFYIFPMKAFLFFCWCICFNKKLTLCELGSSTY
ncbi:hypothetical protein MtrunA17_Chr6g0457981 [Medicago truncatula]|uniref:Nodule Cysteine-Rich (NCR) secreted peptide n=1 Tax=Medicago truncatula TaxID=3880 RepID=I3SA40_MEDTR|nr:unknown [Medicago truncatula]KEH25375.1 Nodule Cysteine-Rich (NCR) secreted peptide [Medicago truncatula]RHN50493.1 hypothetical protein MtrunA17_Chr6g0457981 [Medicago truncatula]